MTDRTETKSTRTINTPASPIPMPGRLAVDFYDKVLRTSARGPLAEQKPGTQVTATGTITLVRILDRAGRVHVVLTDDYGQSALVDFPPATTALIAPLLTEGTRITVAGLATRAGELVPAGIAGYNAQIAGAR